MGHRPTEPCDTDSRATGPKPAVHVERFSGLDPRTAYLLWQLRESVFVVEQQCAYLELDGRDLEEGTRHVWAEVAGRPVGYVRVLDDDAQLRIGRVLVAPSHRGTGLSNVLMQRALDVVGDRPSVLHAQTPLATSYAGFGYVPDGPEFLDDGIPHLPMRRAQG
jgi:ElaA protein